MASYTVVNILEKIVSRRLTFTKSNDELESILTGLYNISKSISIEKLKQYETENTSSNSNLWKKIFS